jgi:NADP-dependent 3-hydroxy acid dehydrogenase YdfG
LRGKRHLRHRREDIFHLHLAAREEQKLAALASEIGASFGVIDVERPDSIATSRLMSSRARSNVVSKAARSLSPIWVRLRPAGHCSG